MPSGTPRLCLNSPLTERGFSMYDVGVTLFHFVIKPVFYQVHLALGNQYGEYVSYPYNVRHTITPCWHFVKTTIIPRMHSTCSGTSQRTNLKYDLRIASMMKKTHMTFYCAVCQIIVGMVSDVSGDGWVSQSNIDDDNRTFVLLCGKCITLRRALASKWIACAAW